MRLIKKIAEYFGWFYCPACKSFFRTKHPIMMGGHTICEKCASAEISRRIAGWYGDYK